MVVIQFGVVSIIPLFNPDSQPQRNVWNEADRCTKGNYIVPKNMSRFMPGEVQLSPEPQKRKPKIDDTPTHLFDVEKFEKEHTQVPTSGGVVSSVVGRNMNVDEFEERKLRKRQVLGTRYRHILSAAVPV